MNPPELAVATLVEGRDDLLDCTPYRNRFALLVTSNLVVTLLDDVAVPPLSRQVIGRVYRFDGNDRKIFFVGGRHTLDLPAGLPRSKP